MFKGTSDLEVLCRIFEVQGTVKPGEWPECEELPCYLPMCESEALPILPGLEKAPELNALLKSMLRLNPKDRPTCEDLKAEVAKMS